MIPTSDQFDLVIIGGGPGGYSAALYAASAGMKVALVEVDALGGTCLNRGCIPAKAFLETAAVHRHVAHAADFGIEAGAPSVNFKVTQERKQKIVAGLVGGVAAMCKGRKVEVFNGWGSLGPDHTVTVTATDGSTTQITGTNVILAAGSVPRLIPGFERGGPIMTSDEVLDLDYVPDAHGRHRRRRHRVRVRLGVRRPRRRGDDPRGSPEDPARASTRTSPTSSCKSFKQKKIDIRTGVMVHGHTPNDQRRHHGALRRRTRTSRSTPSSCRSVDGRSPTTSASTAPGSRSTSAASSSSTSSAAPARTASSPSAT